MEQFPTREKNTLDLIITSLPSQLLDIQSPDRLSDHDIVSGTLKIVIPPIKKPRRKVYRYQKGDYESMRSDALRFAKERYFNGYSDTRSVQEKFNFITSFIQDSADKHIQSKTSRSVSSVPWITPAIRRKICRKNATHAKAKKSGSAKIRAKFEILRREIKADIRKQHDLYQPQIVAIKETKIDSFISTSELFPESCPYNVYRKDRTLDGGGVMLLIHKDISHMPITELENDSVSVWVKVFANKTSLFVASWYRQPGGNLEKLDSQLKSLESQLEKIKDIHKGNKPPSVHILGDFNFCDIVWPVRLSKSGSPLSLSEGEKFIEILNDRHLEQLVHFPTREKNTLDLIITSLPS